MTYSISKSGGEERGSGDRWIRATSNIAVMDADGKIVASYRRVKSFRSVEARAEFLDEETGRWAVKHRAPEGFANLRAWFLAEAARRYGVGGVR